MLNTGGMTPVQFADARDRLLGEASSDPQLTSVRLSELPDVASLKINVDQQRIAALGLNAADVNNTLSTAWGGRYVDDFIDRGRVKRVYVQGDAPYRSRPVVRPQQPGRHGAFLVIRRYVMDHDTDQLLALPWLSLVRDFGSGGARRQLGPGDEHH
jgi:multidrug efflux pump subunit AcrB